MNCLKNSTVEPRAHDKPRTQGISLSSPPPPPPLSGKKNPVQRKSGIATNTQIEISTIYKSGGRLARDH